MATVSAGGGTAPYHYLWSNGSTDEKATGLLAGATYEVTVTDANGNLVTYKYDKLNRLTDTYQHLDAGERAHGPGCPRGVSGLLRPAGQPSIEPKNLDDGKDLEYVATFEVFPEVVANLRKLSPYWDNEKNVPRKDVPVEGPRA